MNSRQPACKESCGKQRGVSVAQHRRGTLARSHVAVCPQLATHTLVRSLASSANNVHLTLLLMVMLSRLQPSAQLTGCPVELAARHAQPPLFDLGERRLL